MDLSNRREDVLVVRGNRVAAGRHRRLRRQVIRGVAEDARVRHPDRHWRTSTALLWQVLREGGRITAVGIGIGVLLALVTGKILQSFLHGVDAVEPIVLVTAPLILLASSLLASYIPALRATKVDPTVALRSE